MNYMIRKLRSKFLILFKPIEEFISIWTTGSSFEFLQVLLWTYVMIWCCCSRECSASKMWVNMTISSKGCYKYKSMNCIFLNFQNFNFLTSYFLQGPEIHQMSLRFKQFYYGKNLKKPFKLANDDINIDNRNKLSSTV